MNKDKVYLSHILTNISHIQRLTQAGKETFLADPDRQAAILYYLQTLSESAGRISETLRASQPQIAWQQIKGFRNRVVHDYLSIDLNLVWGIIENELPTLKTAIEAMQVDTNNEVEEE